MNWLEEIEKIVDAAQIRRVELSRELSHADQALTDVRHYMEFNDLNMYQGYLAYKKMQEVLQERRKIKDELDIISYLPKKELRNTIKRIEGMEHRKYRPRVLTELFENTTDCDNND